MTGQMAPEEIEFRKEESELEKELFRFETIENVIKSDLDKHQEALKTLKDNYDEARESLRFCRKLYKKYAKETKLFNEEKIRRKRSDLIAGKEKAHAVLTNMVINSYVKA